MSSVSHRSRLPFIFTLLFAFIATQAGFSEADSAPANQPVTLPPAAETPAATLAAQRSEDIFFNTYASLDDLLKQNLTVSTLKEVNEREAPGIITVIRQDEIANSGARDLMDVLRLVPSIEFASDVSGVVDIGIRGLWAHEGKVLFMLDGQPLNEIAYGTMELGNHIPVENIKRIEIIRGPGSAIYGGYAELGVINIITKNGKDLNGVEIDGVYSQMAKTYSHRDLNLSFGKNTGGLDLSGHLLWGQGNRSDQTFTSFNGQSYDMSTHSQLNPLLLNLGFEYQGLSFRSIIDQYHTTERDWWGVNLPSAVRADFNTNIMDLKYDWKLGSLTLTPRINLKEQEPYQRNGVGTKNIIPETYTEAGDDQFEIWVKRKTESLIASYDFNEKTNLLAGIEDYQEQGETISDPEPQLIQYNNFATFVQGLVDLYYVNLTAGARFERHSQYGNALVPRLGLTKAFGDWHFKLLYAKAFRVPQLETIQLNPEIRPEYSRTTEFEAGCQLTEKMFLTLNLFDTLIDNPIIYYATADAEYQVNSGPLGTRGAELAYTYRDAWGFVNLGYSFNRCTQDEGFLNPESGIMVDSIYKVPGHDDRTIGLPGHKVTLNASIRLLGQLTLNPSVIWFSQRYGYNSITDTAPEEIAPVALANLFVTYAFTKELQLGAGVDDITNSAPVYLQAYNGGHAAIPGPSRAVVGKIRYALQF
jgi:outer membrane cobalamin receptor